MTNSKANVRTSVNSVYLTILSRYATDDELQAIDEYTKSQRNNRRIVVIDLIWALINSPEFLYRH